MIKRAMAGDDGHVHDHTGVLELIGKVRSGELSGRTLDVPTRRRCVMALLAEGYAIAEIAGVLGCSERTVARDRAAMREALSAALEDRWLPRMLGTLLAEAEGSAMRLKRIARDRSTPAQTRVEAERTAWGMTKDMVRMLQRLGVLPEASHRVSAQISGQISARFGASGGPGADAPSIDELHGEVERLRRVYDTVEGGHTSARLVELAARIKRIELHEEIVRIEAQIEQPSSEASVEQGDQP